MILVRLSALALALVSLASAQAPLEIREVLVLGPLSLGGRSPVHADPVEAEIVAGRFAAPSAGEEVEHRGGKAAWRLLEANEEGLFVDPALRGGYACAVVEVEESRTMILEAEGHSMVYADGAPRVGDVYRTGWTRTPLSLRKGRNVLLFLCARGVLRARLVGPPLASEGVFFSGSDDTVPDLVAGEVCDTEAAVVVVNTSPVWRRGLFLSAWPAEGPEGGAAPHLRSRTSAVPALPPMSITKVSFPIIGRAPETTGRVRLHLTISRRDRRRRSQRRRLDRRMIDLRVVSETEVRRRTFRSAIDGSVQYWAQRPALEEGRNGLVLTLHGASVEANRQAAAYSSKPDLEIVAPTNRRPYGFDWEDWGRKDALEVLDLAQRLLGTDPTRVYLTGHSMGGHGSWHLATTHPDRFAAVAPSAGWVSMFSYAGARRAGGDAMTEILQRCMNGSDTLARLSNLDTLGVYVLHGDADDNVPPTEARTMKAALERTHPDFGYHEQEGAGHWWDGDRAGGADCVDWPEIFETFSRTRRPPSSEVADIDFVTASPAMSSDFAWLRIEAQQRALMPSRVVLGFDAPSHVISGRTENVRRLSLDLDDLRALAPRGHLRIVLDEAGPGGVALDEEAEGRIFFERGEAGWTQVADPGPGRKNPARQGPFKEAFDRRFLFVVGTGGSEEERAWALAKARYDAETFWYRGNGSPEMILDRDFVLEAEPERSVILYGNAATNSAWEGLLGASPVVAESGRIKIGERVLERGDLALLLVRPRPGSERALVAAISGSGVRGMRLCDRLPIFVSGVAYPDFTVIAPEALERGIAGVVAAGFFGDDWSLADGEIVLREEAR